MNAQEAFAVLGAKRLPENSIASIAEQEMRFRCLQLAQGVDMGANDEVARAATYYAFVTDQLSSENRSTGE